MFGSPRMLWLKNSVYAVKTKGKKKYTGNTLKMEALNKNTGIAQNLIPTMYNPYIRLFIFITASKKTLGF